MSFWRLLIGSFLTVTFLIKAEGALAQVIGSNDADPLFGLFADDLAAETSSRAAREEREPNRCSADKIKFIVDGRMFCVSPMRWDSVRPDRISFDLCIGPEYRDEGRLFCVKIRFKSDEEILTIEFILPGLFEWRIPYCELRQIEPGVSWEYNCKLLEKLLRGAFPDFEPNGIVTTNDGRLCFKFRRKDLCWPGKEPTLTDPAQSSLADSIIQ